MISRSNALERPDVSAVRPPTVAPGAVPAGGARTTFCRTPQAIRGAFLAQNSFRDPPCEYLPVRGASKHLLHLNRVRMNKRQRTNRYRSLTPHKRKIGELDDALKRWRAAAKAVRPIKPPRPVKPAPVLRGEKFLRTKGVARGLALVHGGVFYRELPQARGQFCSSDRYLAIRRRFLLKWVENWRARREVSRLASLRGLDRFKAYRRRRLRSAPLGVFSVYDANVLRPRPWNKYWQLVTSELKYQVNCDSFPLAMARPFQYECALDQEPYAHVFRERRTAALVLLRRVCRKYIRGRFRTVSLYKKQDYGGLAFVLLAVAIVTALLLLWRKYRWEAEIVWASCVGLAVAIVCCWRWFEFGELTHLTFFGLSGRFEYGTFGSTWKYSCFRGRESNFYGSGYVSTETRVVRNDIIAVMMNQHMSSAVTTTTARSCRQVALIMLEPELERLRGAALSGRYESLIRMVHWSAIYVTQTLELLEVQTSDRTSNRTRAALVDQDFIRRGGSGTPGSSWIRTVLGRPPPNL